MTHDIHTLINPRPPKGVVTTPYDRLLIGYICILYLSCNASFSPVARGVGVGETP